MTTQHPERPIAVMAVYGTRPEAIKMAPLVLALHQDPRFRVRVVVTGQHREMLDQVNHSFGIVPDHDLDIHSPGQTLTQISNRTLDGLSTLFETDRPDAVLVQGDTTTTFAAALAAFYAGVDVVHTEAGLRTGNRHSPFPEEINRRLTSHLATLHLSPTAQSRENLLRENIDPATVVVTGNSVIDALLLTVASRPRIEDTELATRLATGRPVVLVTAHRRESWGEPLRQVGRALGRLADAYPDYEFVFPAHRNPLVREAIVPQVHDRSNVIVTEPLPYAQFCALMERSSIILTDSGGVQEEGPSLGKPVLVMRDTTERPEAVTAGTVRLVGTDEQDIVEAVSTLIEDPEVYEQMACALNPYGDGRAAERTLQALARHYGLGGTVEEFDEQATPVALA
ncbi:non-hydrolyzing UDP-N-acetylglucosamine 2-epimerase [Kocuria rosea]|uniref:non-hydrolyzing UDP-N-acetylglucosamine 2-epimerase n=1 Tax=Kocuria rosea TaxID=1275 RepID=UPI00204049EF|nr:UDP-N-acetylglucosamine 2-epimerase (non-hydrolyzing) [Kocuria rosea]MCM3687845.1 UDP-N-acetylglucosamine 2-epimerase (non-hydrolyzing) [Kocuria rosea]